MPQNSEVLERASSLRVLGPRDMDLDTETENVLPPDVWHGVLWYLGAEVVGGCGCRGASEFKEIPGLITRSEDLDCFISLLSFFKV